MGINPNKPKKKLIQKVVRVEGNIAATRA